MKHFEPHVFDPIACRKEVLELQQLLAGSGDLSERKDINPHFKVRRNLSALAGMYNPSVVRFDRLAWRRDHVIVHSKQIHCLTFDQFVADSLFWLEKKDFVHKPGS